MTSRPRTRRATEGGFTLIELMVALTILVVVIAASTSAMDMGLRTSQSTRQQVAAADVVNNVIDQLHATALTAAGFGAIPVTTKALPPQTVGATVFTLSQTAEWVGQGQSSSACTGATSTSLLLRVTVTATWPQDVAPVSSTTTLSAPPGTFSAADGTLAVTVLNSASQPLSGMTVTATAGSTTQSITTGPDGCAFFAQLPAASYSVTLGGAAGLVDSLENSPPAALSAPVVAGQPASLQFNVDSSGSITYTLGSGSPAAPPAGGMGVSLYDTQWFTGPTTTPYHMKTYPTATGSLPNVFPARYDGIFAGTCTDANPAGTDTSNNPFYSASANPQTAPAGGPTATTVTVTPSGAASVVVPLYTLKLTTTNAANAPYRAAISPPGKPPTALVGAGTATTEGAACPAGAPTWTLSPVTAGVSTTAVGLGHLAITMTVTSGTSTLTGTANVWVTPYGVYTYNPSTGAVGTLIYSFSSPGTVDVVVQ